MAGDTDAIWAEAGRRVFRMIARSVIPLIIVSGIIGLAAMLTRS